MANSRLFEWDELNLLRDYAEQFVRRGEERDVNQKQFDDFCDYIEFVLCLVYAYGWKDAEEIVGIVPMKDGLDDKAVNLEIGGETFRDRIETQLRKLSVAGVLKVIDTEAHRDYNTGVYDAAEESGQTGLMKQWWTMQDERVRDTHDYLDGARVGLDDAFYTYDGDSAMYPGGFSKPENNVNCRCWITLARA